MSLSLSEAGIKSKLLHIVYFLEAIIFTSAVLEKKANHIHAHFGTNSTTVAMLASNLSGIPFSFTVHGPEEFDRPDSLRLREKISAARFVVAISSYGRSQLMRWSEISDWSKIIVVRCGIERSFYEEYDENIPETDSLVCVGRLCEQKGQVLLVEAVRDLVSNGCSIHLTFVGDGDMRPDIEHRISKYGLQDHVTITGWLDGEGVREQILRSRALVLPSFAEGLPVVLMEAMALKRPVISTYVAGIPELVESGHSGWLVPAGSVDQLGNAIYQVLNTPIDELRNIGEAARTSVVRQHDIDDQVAILIENFSHGPEMRQDELVQ